MAYYLDRELNRIDARQWKTLNRNRDYTNVAQASGYESHVSLSWLGFCFDSETNPRPFVICVTAKNGTKGVPKHLSDPVWCESEAEGRRLFAQICQEVLG